MVQKYNPSSVLSGLLRVQVIYLEAYFLDTCPLRLWTKDTGSTWSYYRLDCKVIPRNLSEFTWSIITVLTKSRSSTLSAFKFKLLV